MYDSDRKTTTSETLTHSFKRAADITGSKSRRSVSGIAGVSYEKLHDIPVELVRKAVLRVCGQEDLQ
eukprot:m.332388 g.332388  ORF g.332388 m.332388 type:complete len:67 (-) comp55636_c0_seq1:124-324(-)